MSDEAERSRVWSENAMAAFVGRLAAGAPEQAAAAAAVEIHTLDAGLEGGLEGDREIQVWHLLLSLANYSDDKGFFRDQVFGPPQAGGPRVHKLVCALRDLCEARGYAFDDLYEEVNEHIAACGGPLAPGI